jgi:negative regulator of flagellin synthesis FlgM
MVDGIGWTGAKRVAAATPAVEVQATGSDAPRVPVRTPTPAPELRSLAKTLASTPPVDGDRVAQIKRAIQTGTFPILPATIADRLLALKLEWNGRDRDA